MHFHIFSLSYNLTSDDLWPWYMTFDCMNIWVFTYLINTPSLVQIGLQLCKWGNFHIFSLSYNLTSDDLWPHQQMRVPMLNLWPNCGWNSSKHVEDSAKSFDPFFTTDNNNRQQGTKWSLSVFPAKAGNTKTPFCTSFEKPVLQVRCMVWFVVGLGHLTASSCLGKLECTLTQQWDNIDLHLHTSWWLLYAFQLQDQYQTNKNHN